MRVGIVQESSIHIMNFRQSEDAVLMEICIEGNRTSDRPLIPVILAKITHPPLASDYGSGARVWLYILLD